MKMKICFYNSIINFRFLSKISVRDKFQLIFIKRFKSLIVYFLTSHIISLEIKIIILENLLIVNKIQSHSFDKSNDFKNVEMKSIIKI